MKRFLNIFIAVVLVVLSAFMLIGCNDQSSQVTTRKGLSYKKNKDGVYIVTSYKDEGKGVTELDIGAILEESDVILDTAQVKIKKGAFSGDAYLTKVVVPTCVIEIEEGAFMNMNALKTLEVPFIGRTAKADYSVNKNFPNSSEKSVDSARTIAHFFGTEAYGGGKSITINYGASTKTCYAPVTFENVVLNSKESYAIPMYAFNGATNVTSVTLNKNVNVIGENAFTGCINLAKVVVAQDASASSISVLENAFKGCIRLNAFASANDGEVDLLMVKEVAKDAFDFGSSKTYTVLNAGSIDLAKAFGETLYK